MVSLGLCFRGSGKPAILSTTAYQVAVATPDSAAGKTPNDPHPIGVSVRLIPG